MSTTEAMIEQAAERVEAERDLRVAAIQQAAHRLQSNDAAVLVCGCGSEISAARLQALPGTRRCIDCARKSEQRAGGFA